LNSFKAIGSAQVKARREKAKAEKSYKECRKAGIESVPEFLFSLLKIFVRRFWFQLPATLDEQEKNAGAETKEHDGNAGGDAPESSGGRAAIVAAADDDVARHGDEQFEDAAAQQPAGAAFQKGIFVIRFCEPAEN
jgi:hypothetical protein